MAVTQADTTLVANGSQKENIEIDYQKSARYTRFAKLTDWTEQAKIKIEEHTKLVEAEKLAEEERVAEEKRLAEEARIAENKRREEKQLAEEAAEKERLEAIARADKKRAEKAASKHKDGFFIATAYYPLSEDQTTSTGENLMKLIKSGQRIVACNDYPLNTILYINGKSWRVADRMETSGHIDFLRGSEEEVSQFGRQKVKVEVAN